MSKSYYYLVLTVLVLLNAGCTTHHTSNSEPEGNNLTFNLDSNFWKFDDKGRLIYDTDSISIESYTLYFGEDFSKYLSLSRESDLMFIKNGYQLDTLNPRYRLLNDSIEHFKKKFEQMEGYNKEIILPGTKLNPSSRKVGTFNKAEVNRLFELINNDAVGEDVNELECYSPGDAILFINKSDRVVKAYIEVDVTECNNVLFHPRYLQSLSITNEHADIIALMLFAKGHYQEYHNK